MEQTKKWWGKNQGLTPAGTINILGAKGTKEERSVSEWERPEKVGESPSGRSHSQGEMQALSEIRARGRECIVCGKQSTFAPSNFLGAPSVGQTQLKGCGKKAGVIQSGWSALWLQGGAKKDERGWGSIGQIENKQQVVSETYIQNYPLLFISQKPFYSKPLSLLSWTTSIVSWWLVP